MTHDLVLYKYDVCPFCYRVQSWLDGRDIDVSYRDTREDPTARQELVDKTGRATVPCLFIDGEPMHESGDILDWLQANYGEPKPEPVSAPSTAAEAQAPERRRSRILKRFKRG